MKNSQKGSVAIVLVVIAVLVIGGAYITINSNVKTGEDVTPANTFSEDSTMPEPVVNQNNPVSQQQIQKTTQSKTATKPASTQSPEEMKLREGIKYQYYGEYSYEICMLNDYKNEGFSSQEQCNLAVMCIASAFASTIPTDDLKNLNQEMVRSHGEGASLNYFRTHPGVETKFNIQKRSCLE
jgi:hypothetical protein